MHRGALFLSLLLLCAISTFATPLSNVEDYSNNLLSEDSEEERLEDPEIEEIANREYETTHDRVLAVNMAHWRKRGLNKTDDNVFDNIELDNEGFKVPFYQGDIINDEDLEEYLHKPVRSRTKRNAIKSRSRLWTSRVIPYEVPGYMSHIRKNVMIAIANFQKHTCLRFVQYQPGRHKNWITFGQRDGCSSKIGKLHYMPGKQIVSIGSGCNKPGTIIHEMLHAIGFFHEQARADRDKFVEIKWENIKSGFADQFDKYTWKTIDNLGQLYDTKSIMHYGRHAFSKNGQPTIVAIGDKNKKLGNRADRLSDGDIIEINALYDCKVTQYGWTKWSEYTPCNDKCYKSRERYCYHPGNRKYCGGKVNAYGIETDDVKCTKLECLGRNSVSGNWGHWSSWSVCTAKCDDGAHSRVRQCNNPAPSKYGKQCPGTAKEEAICTVRRCSPGPEDTDFDDTRRPLGMWRNTPGAQINWKRHKGFTQTMSTGPMTDHTTGKGYYLYIESSGRNMKNKKAKLLSKDLTIKPGGQCLKLYYMLHGKTIGSLEVNLIRNGRKQKTLFFKKGNQGLNWLYATASLQYQEGKYEIEIVGTIGDSGYSDIAIDDVYIDDGLCSCQDKYVSCMKWSSTGECQRNKDWMSKECPRSCHICIAPVCKDRNTIQCPLWAARGACNKNKAYMDVNCAKSCKKCKAPAAPGAPAPRPQLKNKGPVIKPMACEDKSRLQCPLWARKGECSHNKEFMHKHCAKSCKICKVPVCKDSNAIQCPLWAAKGECDKNKDFMDTNCAKSCKKCKGCDDQNSSCQAWAKRGDCQKNPAYMDVICPKACGKC